MPSTLRDIDFVDLKRSKWNRNKSNPKKGEYDLEKLVYYKNKDFREGYIHPYKLKWCKFTEYDSPRPFATWELWKLRFKATFLTVQDDYWPEGLSPDNEGKYVFSDLVAVKIPIEVHVEHKRKAREKSEMQSAGLKKQFEAEKKREGVDIPEKAVEDEMDRIKRDVDSIGI